MIKSFVAPIVAALLATGCTIANIPARQSDTPVIYHNDQYGLTFSLPAEWRGYSVLPEKWQSVKYNPDLDKDVVGGHGPIIILRHPMWTVDQVRQDIPILVFTRDQWATDMQDGIFAGGVEYEISHNARYVFAIHSRFNWDDSVTGWQDAGEIVGRNESASAHLPSD
jgi:hypothetical protein